MKLQITIDGKAYAVDVEVLEDEESQQTQENSPHHAAHNAGDGHVRSDTHKIRAARGMQRKSCRSPVMGLVIKVNVEPGQAVEAGALLLVLEAMKMETKVTAPRAATVKSVHVKQGDPVKVNQLLVEFE